MAHIISISFLSQLRRNAKRLARRENLSHTQALDRLARERGYSNWSLLVKHAHGQEAPNSMSTVTVPARVSAPVFSGLPRLDASHEERLLIRDIVARYASLVEKYIPVNRLSTLMDLEACHRNGCPLDLVALRDAPRDEDVVHDVAGIARHMDRETGTLSDMFRPRYSR